MTESIDRELAQHLGQLEELERAEHWTDQEVVGAQQILVDTASWLRGIRPPASWDEAWQRIHQRRDAGRLRGTGFGGTG